MSKFFLFLLCAICGFNNAHANYSTPGTGVNWSLGELVSNAGGTIILQNGVYFVNGNITISTNDAVSITTNASLSFAAGAIWQVSGTFLVDPPSGVLFTAQDPVAGFGGLRLELGSSSQLNKLTFEYASALRISDCSPTLTDCIIRYNTSSTTLGSGAITMFRAKPTLINCQFIENRRAAISGGGNIANAPQIIGCSFTANNTLNLNVPQINLGASGTDTVRILNCSILGGNNNSGGIGVFPLGNANVVIKQSLIRGNRYGITLIGGSGINALVAYNRIDFNNIQNNPNLGGSGIAFSGGGAGNAQNTIVTGNVFEGNLWGITIFSQSGGVPIAGSRPNLGNLNNVDTSDDGKNRFINNNNLNTPGVDLYNNSSDPIFAMGNYWNTNVEAEVEGKIFHNNDDLLLGLVTYSSFITPVVLTLFTAQQQGKTVALQWQTLSELNSEHFVVETSTTGQNFVAAGTVPATGYSTVLRRYSFMHQPGIATSERIYYRLKMIDKDGSFNYSAIVSVDLESLKGSMALRAYPTAVSEGEILNIEIHCLKPGPASLQVLAASGSLLSSKPVSLVTGLNKLSLILLKPTPAGTVILRLVSKDWQHSTNVVYF